MKRIILLAAVVASACTLQAQEVSTTQWVQIQKRTATWCSFCGQWGWEFKTDMENTYEGQDVLVWSAHFDGALENPTAIALSNNYPANAQPRFYIDGADLGVSNSNREAKKAEVQEVVDLNSSFPPFYGCGADAEYDGNTITVTARAEYFEGSGSSPVHLGVYLMRKETIAPQAARPGNSVHKNLVVNHFTDEVFGDEISSTVQAAGSEFFVEGSLELPNEDISNYNVVTILWSFTEGQYRFINANVQEIAMSTSVADTYLAETNVTVTYASGFDLGVRVDSETAMDDATFTIFSTSGQVITSAQRDVAAETTELALPVSTMPAGLYILNLQHEGKSISTQFVMH